MKYYILFAAINTLVISSLNAQCVDYGNYWNESWVSCSTSANPNPARGNTYWILYEFHESQYIDSTHIWNANRIGESGWGANEVIFDYSIDGGTWVELGQYTFPQAPESSNYTGFPGPDFDGLFLKKILITIISTHDASGCASLAEAKFLIDQTACYGTIDACGVCNGPGEETWYLDADGDGLGDINTSISSCTQPAGYVENGIDPCDNGFLGWSDIGPMFDDKGCTGCHGNNAAGGLDLRTYTSTQAGGFICSSLLLTGSKLVDIITTSNYDGCGTPIGFPSMNDRVGNPFNTQELDLLQAWIDGGAPEQCADFCQFPPNCTLPVELLSFQVRKNGDNALLTWITETEINNDYFEVQHSIDGIEFRTIGTVEGMGNTNENTYYNFLHENPIRGNNYYRLKQVDFDGTYHYTDIKMLHFDNVYNFSIRPTISKHSVSLVSLETFDTNVDIEIIDANGQIIDRYQMPSGQQEQSMDIIHLASGHYFARVFVKETVFTLKFIKID